MRLLGVAVALEAVVDSLGRVSLRSELREDSFCDGFSAPEYAKVGCGVCATACHGGADRAAVLVGNASTFSSIGACLDSCEGCAAITVARKPNGFACTRHAELPAVVHCGDACVSECDKNGAACQDQVCLSPEVQLKEGTALLKLGDGECARDCPMNEVSRYEGELTEKYEAFRDRCVAGCKGSPACRSVTVSAVKSCPAEAAGVCDSARPVCIEYGSTPRQAVAAGPGSEGLCTACRGEAVDTAACSACTPTAAECVAKTTRTKPSLLRRGHGLCHDSAGAEPSVLFNMSFSSAVACQEECHAAHGCTGVAWAACGEHGFCRLYGGKVTRTSAEAAQLGLCGHACAACEACSGPQEVACEKQHCPVCTQCMDSTTTCTAECMAFAHV